MLNPSYGALRQFQNKFQKTQNLAQIKELLTSLQLEMTLQITSSSVWILDWDVMSGDVSGTMELGLQPQVFAGKEVFHSETGRLRVDSAEMSATAFEAQVLGALKDVVEKMRCAY